ncbi:DUF1905 domain-containing protein, partial [Enterococcus faecium]|nr:DUF1905 domain-containing protein [Enterococcus faecium]
PKKLLLERRLYGKRNCDTTFVTAPNITSFVATADASENQTDWRR